MIFLLTISNVYHYFLYQILCIITCNIFALILDLLLSFPVQNFKFLPLLEQILQGKNEDLLFIAVILLPYKTVSNLFVYLKIILPVNHFFSQTHLVHFRDLLQNQ